MKKIIISILLLSVMVLSACGGGTSTHNTANTYLGGTEGLRINFASGAPPESVSDSGGEQEFDIIVELLNRGEHRIPIGNAQVTIKGFPPEAFGYSHSSELIKTNDEELLGRTKNPDGTIIEPPMYQILFEGLEYVYKEPGNQAFPVVAEVCYNYETNIATNLCILEDFTNTRDNTLCKVSSPRDTSTSGAPVQITKIVQSPAGKDKTRFTFTVQNAGLGNIYKKDSVIPCENKVQFENKVHVEIENLIDRGADSVTCSGLTDMNDNRDAGYVTLQTGETRDILCTVTMNDRNDRIQPFNIKLTYDYLESVRTALIVEYTPE